MTLQSQIVWSQMCYFSHKCEEFIEFTEFIDRFKVEKPKCY